MRIKYKLDTLDELVVKAVTEECDCLILVETYQEARTIFDIIKRNYDFTLRSAEVVNLKLRFEKGNIKIETDLFRCLGLSVDYIYIKGERTWTLNQHILQELVVSRVEYQKEQQLNS